MSIALAFMLFFAQVSVAQTDVAARNSDSLTTKKYFKGKIDRVAGDLKLNDFPTVIQSKWRNTFKQKLSFNDVSFSTDILRIDNQNAFNYSFGGTVSIFSLPLKLQIVNNSYGNLLSHPLQGALFSTGFNKESLLNTLTPDLSRYKELKAKKIEDRSFAQYLNEEIANTVKSKINKDRTELNEIYNYINQHGNVEKLLKLNEYQLKEKLNALVDEKKMNISNKVSGVLDDKQIVFSTRVESEIDTIVAKFLSLNQEFQEIGINPQQMVHLEQLANKKLDVKDYLRMYASNKVYGNSLQKTMNKLSDLKLGSFGDQIPGSFINKDLFLQGGAITLQTVKGSLHIGFASTTDIGFSKDEGFTSSNFNIPKYLTFLSIPVLGNDFSKGRISWTGSLEKQSFRLNEQANVSSRSGSALTLSQDLVTKKAGVFSVEVSKSASAYRNVGQIGSEHLLLEQNTFGNYFKDNLFETMSLGLKYDLNDQKSRFKTNLFFNYSGIGFQNPAQQGFGNMGMRMGGSIYKGFFRNKMTFNLRGDLKNTPVSGSNNAHWKNHNLNIDARFRVSRKFNLSLKYMDNGVQKNAEINQSIYSSRKFQFDASSSYKLFKKSGFSHLIMGVQQMNNPIAKTSSQFLTSIYNQSLSLGKFNLLGNIFYNKELGNQSALGDMINGDASIQYSLLKDVNVSSGITYFDNKGQARQFGIKQNAQFNILKNMEVHLYVDVRRNLITPLYSELFASNRGEVSLKYYLR